MRIYIELGRKILETGTYKNDRTGAGTISLHGESIRIPVNENAFPIITSKYVPFWMVRDELLWFLSGSTNNHELVKKKINIWTEDNFNFYKKNGGALNFEEFKVAIKHNRELGNLGKQYGWLWRNLSYYDHEGFEIRIDQISTAINQIKNNPTSRRIIVNSWNIPTLDSMALPACHTMFQLLTRGNKLDMILYMRSSDVFLGLPFNITSYALLLFAISKYCNLESGELVIHFGDVHIYQNHVESFLEMESNKRYELPKLVYNDDVCNSIDIYDYCKELDFRLHNYNHNTPIKAKLNTGLQL